MPVTLTDFQVVRPEFELLQEESLKWLAALHSRAGVVKHDGIHALLRKIGLGEQKVQKRGVSFRDCIHHEWNTMEVFDRPEGAGFGKRSEIYDRITTEVLRKIYVGRELPEHLVHVTCTGYVAPSPAQKLVSERRGGTAVTHAYHMGCYAAIPAIRMGRGADVVHTEVCSLHVNPMAHEMEQLVIQTLFADGFIKYTVSEKETAGFRVVKLEEMIIPDSTEVMTWICHDWGLKMKLSLRVPELIAKALPSFAEKLLKHASGDVYFAIHPGGPKIINQVAKILELKPSQYEHSLWVLQNYGNMSSATLPHIWDRMWNDQQVKSGATIISLAFGPGLTLVGGVFECVR